LRVGTESEEVAMGRLLEGEVELVAKRALEGCHFEVSLTLFALVRVYVGEPTRAVDRWAALGEPTKVTIPKHVFQLAAGERRSCRFSMHAPIHEPTNSRATGFTAVWCSGADLKRTMRMTASELLRDKQLKWVAEVTAVGVPGMLRAERELRVVDQATKR
jgi:hypothetical protein